jgi:hypothetical protein
MSVASGIRCKSDGRGSGFMVMSGDSAPLPQATTPWTGCCGWPSSNIEDKRARERAARRAETGKRADQPARLVEGQRVTGWREALNELDTAYPG